MGYAKTTKGHDVVKTRSVALAPRMRTLLLLCDGHREAPELLATVAGATQADLDELLVQGLIEAPASASVAHGTATNTAAVDAVPAQGTEPVVADEATRYREAYAIATQLVSELGLRGFRLQLAVESAMTLKQLSELAPRLREALEKAHGAHGARSRLASFDKALRGH